MILATPNFAPLDPPATLAWTAVLGATRTLPRALKMFASFRDHMASLHVPLEVKRLDGRALVLDLRGAPFHWQLERRDQRHTLHTAHEFAAIGTLLILARHTLTERLTVTHAELDRLSHGHGPLQPTPRHLAAQILGKETTSQVLTCIAQDVDGLPKDEARRAVNEVETQVQAWELELKGFTPPDEALGATQVHTSHGRMEVIRTPSGWSIIRCETSLRHLRDDDLRHWIMPMVDALGHQAQHYMDRPDPPDDGWQ